VSESIAARRAAASRTAAACAIESPAAAIARAAESAPGTEVHTVCTPASLRFFTRRSTGPTLASATDGCSRYVRAHFSAVWISRMTVPTGIPAG
jgi:hypothetical protein